MIRASIFLVLFLISCGNPVDYSRIAVKEVVDGDTIRLVNGELLRYVGLDTPEVRIKEAGSFVYNPQPFSLEAKEYNRKLVEGKHLRIEFDIEKRDKYGRLLGYCFADDVFINAELLKHGYATLYTFPPNLKYVEMFVDLQKKARKEKRGLWGSYDTISSDEAHKYINQVRSVRGRILGTYQSAKCVFLNFGQDYKTDFTVVIFNNSLSTFREKGINPAVFYHGKTIEVTGRIKSYNGPEIIVNSPYEIELIR